jgi:hypothetical protein
MMSKTRAVGLGLLGGAIALVVEGPFAAAFGSGTADMVRAGIAVIGAIVLVTVSIDRYRGSS